MSAFMSFSNAIQDIGISALTRVLCFNKPLQITTGSPSFQRFHKAFGQTDIFNIQGTTKELSHFFVCISAHATSYTRDEETKILVLFSKSNKLLNRSLNICVFTYSLTKVNRNGIALSLHSLCLSPYRTKFLSGSTRGPTSMIAQRITAKHKNLIRQQPVYIVRRKAQIKFIFHID